MIRLSARDRVALALIRAEEDERLARRDRAVRKGADSQEHGRVRIAYFVAERVCRRWEAAGYTTVRLEDGLPRPERPHRADWQGTDLSRTCGTCGERVMARRAGPTCPGRSAFDLVYQAILDGVPFGLVDGLPTAGTPITLDGILVKVAAATVAKAA